MTQPDPPYYQPARDGRRVHVCRMTGHDKYWLNVQSQLWTCERCHPPTVDCALALVWEIVEGGQGLGVGGQQEAAEEAANDGTTD